MTHKLLLTTALLLVPTIAQARCPGCVPVRPPNGAEAVPQIAAPEPEALPPPAAPIPEPAPPVPPPIGWVYAPYTTCHPPNPECAVNVAVDGLNVRDWPNGLPIASLVTGTPIHVFEAMGMWVKIGIPCNLTLIAWSSTDNVPLYACEF